MASKIEWTEDTWNPTAGCSLVTKECRNCYAMHMAHRIVAMDTKASRKYEGTVRKLENGDVRWTGQINFREEWLLKPLQQKRGTVYFVDSMSDLFHEEQSVEHIAMVWAIMLMCQRHTFQVLTKRAERMQQILSSEDFIGHLYVQYQDLRAKYCKTAPELTRDQIRSLMPAANVWIGVSVGIAAATPRVGHLLRTPAAVRFISAEPLIEDTGLVNVLQQSVYVPWIGMEVNKHEVRKVDWVIVGGESGPNARVMHPDWVRAIQEACERLDITFFFKQWGTWLPWEPTAQPPFWLSQTGVEEDAHKLFPDDWDSAEGLRKWNICLEFAISWEGEVAFQNVGKKKSGNKLDGEQYLQMPKSVL